MEQHISFVVRVSSYGQGQAIRGQIEHIPTGATAHFSDLEQVNTFIRGYLLLSPGPAESTSAPAPADAPPTPVAPDPATPVGSLFSFLRRRPAATGATPLVPLVAPAEAPEAPAPDTPASAGPLLPTPAVVVETPGSPPVVVPILDAEAAPSAPDTPASAGPLLPTPAVVVETPGSPPVVVPILDAEADHPAFAVGGASSALLMSISNPHSMNHVLAAMIEALGNYLPEPAPPLPAPGVAVTSVRERPVGLGGFRGIDAGGLYTAELKGFRLDALVRFQLWGADPAQLDTAMSDLNGQLLSAGDDLRNIALGGGVTISFLRVALEATPPSDFLDSVNGWRKQADYRVLFEYRYQDSGGAESLIARIPIQADQEVRNSPARETTVVTDELVRWDDQSALALVVRGRARVAGLAALSFVPGPNAPGGQIQLLRTFDGASGPPIDRPTLAAFLSAASDPFAPMRHIQVTFASLSDFLDAIGTAGAAMPLGDWDVDGATDQYEPRTLTFLEPIRLASPADRLEIAYLDAPFDQVAVVYLRALRR